MARAVQRGVRMALGRWTGVAVVVGAMTAAAGCAPVEATDGDGPAVAEIVQGDEARDLPFACTISTGRSICSGALVAPNVVLTAGHCVDGAGPWTVRCPYSRDTASVRGSVAVFAPNYPNRDDPSRASIDNDRGSDLGLIRLDRPLAETRVALLDASPLTTGRSVAAVGRIQSGTATSALWRSATFALTAHDSRNGYWGGVDRTIIEAGDSGGPLLDARTGHVVGVNSAGVDARYCRRGVVCDEWAALAPATAWLGRTLEGFVGAATTTPATPATPTAPADPCAAARDCGACTALPTCGWCDGTCRTGTASGPRAGTCGAQPWAWLRSQCR